MSARLDQVAEMRAVNASWCDGLLRMKWSKPGLKGTCLCLRCESTATVNLTDPTGLVDCVACDRQFTLAGFARHLDWSMPPSAIPTLMDPIDP